MDTKHLISMTDKRTIALWAYMPFRLCNTHAIHQRSFQTTLGCAFVQFSDFYRQKKTLKNREVLKTPPITTFLITFLNLINHYIISTLYHLYFI